MERGRTLETNTHVDFFVETDSLLILVETKFTSDISGQTTFNPNRNQLARLIDVGISAIQEKSKKLVVLLLFSARAGLKLKRMKRKELALNHELVLYHCKIIVIHERFRTIARFSRIIVNSLFRANELPTRLLHNISLRKALAAINRSINWHLTHLVVLDLRWHQTELGPNSSARSSCRQRATCSGVAFQIICSHAAVGFRRCFLTIATVRSVARAI